MVLSLATSHAASLCPSDGIEQNIIDKLEANGIEQISVLVEGKEVIVSFENRRYRFEIDALKAINRLIMPFLVQGQQLILIPLNRGIPLVVVKLPNKADSALVDEQPSRVTYTGAILVTQNVDELWGKVNSGKVTNSSLGKFDITIHPQFSARFGNFSNPVEAQFNLVPEISTQPWKGAKVAFQFVIPLYDELSPIKNYYRPGLITINQTFRLPHQAYTSLTLGYYSQFRYGAEADLIKYFKEGNFAVGINTGYTGFANYWNKEVYVRPLDKFTGYIYAIYRYNRYDLSLKATAGQFLWRDKGIRLDAIRQYGEKDIGFFALYTDISWNVGFNFSIPLPFKKRLKPKIIRLGPAKYFNWEYRYKGASYGGIKYDTGNNLQDFNKKLLPGFIKNQLIPPYHN